MAETIRFPLTSAQQKTLAQFEGELAAAEAKVRAYFAGCAEGAPLDPTVKYVFSYDNGVAICTPQES